LAGEQQLEFAGTVQRDHVVVAAHMGFADEDLRHAGAVGLGYHLLALLEIQVDAHLGPDLSLALQKVLGSHAVRANGGGVEGDFRRTGNNRISHGNSRQQSWSEEYGGMEGRYHSANWNAADWGAAGRNAAS
jgi:hypothetical protein